MTMDLAELGWTTFFEESFGPFRAEGLLPARVVRVEKSVITVAGASGELAAEVSGRLRHDAASRSAMPAVGDWVAVEPRPDAEAFIHAVLPRRSCFSRKKAGVVTEEQVIAANVDAVLLVSGLDGGRNFNVPRIERYLTLARECGVAPVVVLNKADLCEDVEACVARVTPVAAGAPMHVTSALTRLGLEELRREIVPGRTVAFLGPSGVGKSSLINDLLGEERLPVGEVRPDDAKGRQTTTWRELIVMPGGGLVIDTPGIRELQMWGDEQTLAGSFADIEELALGCRFSDCEHRTEPGCAVKAAIEAGTLDARRLESYHKQQKELQHLARKQSERARLEEKARAKKFSRLLKDFDRRNPKRQD